MKIENIILVEYVDKINKQRFDVCHICEKKKILEHYTGIIYETYHFCGCICEECAVVLSI